MLVGKLMTTYFCTTQIYQISSIIRQQFKFLKMTSSKMKIHLLGTNLLLFCLSLMNIWPNFATMFRKVNRKVIENMECYVCSEISKTE